jgi:hypothetical protein
MIVSSSSSNISSTSVKEQAYKTLVRPSLEYSCSAWDSYNKIKAKLINSTRSNKGLQDMSPTDSETCLVFVTILFFVESYKER